MAGYMPPATPIFQPRRQEQLIDLGGSTKPLASVSPKKQLASHDDP